LRRTLLVTREATLEIRMLITEVLLLQAIMAVLMLITMVEEVVEISLLRLLNLLLQAVDGVVLLLRGGECLVIY
jgi:hypothetical protein